MKQLPEFLTWKEDGAWLCGWQRFDLLTQGPTERQAQRRMQHALMASFLILADKVVRDDEPEALPPLPNAVLRKWRAAHRRTHG